MIWLIYNSVLPALLILSFPYYFLRMWKRGQISYCWKERFGFYNSNVKEKLADLNSPIWFHAVSVGEVKVASVLIEEIRKRNPKQSIVLSTTTITGRRLAESLERKGVVVIFHSVDLWVCVNQSLKTVNPSMLILIEQELWPNLLYACNLEDVPVWVVNARLSDRSYRRFKKMQLWTRPLLSLLDFVGVPSLQDIKRFRESGFPAHKLFVTGSLKYDVVPELNEEVELKNQRLLDRLGWSDKDQILVFGSTHPEEEEFLLNQIKNLDEGEQRIKVILVPRHAERWRELQNLCQRRSLTFKLRSDLGERSQDPDVLIVDTTGELAYLYGIADINVIGKSFLGIGGQNFLEAARFGKPIIVGPEMSNFRDLVDQFKREGALIQLAENRHFKEKIQTLLDNPNKAQVLGERAQALFSENRGAAGKQAKMILDCLDSVDTPEVLGASG
ncbi:MAG: 3-deoxy-D-manno-octulosonic acid transferase [Verrucomicrobiota bacterium]